jgi:SET domain-containing protein
MARFINHCCVPNAFARVISTPLVDAQNMPGNDRGMEKHITIIAARDIQVKFEFSDDFINIFIQYIF